VYNLWYFCHDTTTDRVAQVTLPKEAAYNFAAVPASLVTASLAAPVFGATTLRF
jgi:hypothetical protein